MCLLADPRRAVSSKGGTCAGVLTCLGCHSRNAGDLVGLVEARVWPHLLLQREADLEVQLLRLHQRLPP